MTNLRCRWIGRYDPSNRFLRLIRIMWERGTVGDGQGYSAKFTVGFRPALFSFHREYQAWFLTIVGLRLHMKRSYGGIHE